MVDQKRRSRVTAAAPKVLHYDSDYDVISEYTDLSFESVWVAKRGSAG